MTSTADTADPPIGAGPLLQVDALCKRFGQRWLLRDLFLRIPPGGSVALLGESGSGKSTLLNLIAGLEPPDSGRILLDGVTVHGLNAEAAASMRRRTIGFVFQAFHLIPHMDATRNVAVPLLLNGVSERDALARAAAMLERTGLATRARALPAELSGGEQQRVALARALVHQPRLLLADEPTGNLDPDTAERALELIAREVRESGAAMLMVTHSTQAAAIADRRLRLVDGALQPA
jgi:putative ABC transport system ATP-binding protein